MNVEQVARIIQFILAPAVLITACAILVNGLLDHYARVSAQLRAMASERLRIVRGSETEAVDQARLRERLLEIDRQLPELLRRHRRIRDAVSLVYLAILSFIADMLLISAAVVSNVAGMAIASLVVFIAGISVLFWGVWFAVTEVSSSQRAVDFEVRRVAGLQGHE